MEYITLNNGAKMPALGFGTFGLPADGTTKIWPTEYPDAEAAVDRALKRLGVEYLDLVYLHHFLGDVKAGWRGLESAVRHGKVRSIGISNFERSDEYMSFFDGIEICRRTPSRPPRRAHAAC